MNNKNLCFHSFIMSIEVVRRKLCCGGTCAQKVLQCLQHLCTAPANVAAATDDDCGGGGGVYVRA